MASEEKIIVKIVVDVDKLKKTGQIQYNCSVCGSSFSNSSCLTVHYVKVHQQGGPLKKKSAVYQYYCPVEKCQYSLEEAKKHFPAMKNLTQHYRKVHADKIYQCNKCEKSFSTERFRQQHLQTCGYIMVCNFCEAEYNSREALLTHIARKHAKQKAALAPKQPVVVETRPRGQQRLVPRPQSLVTSSCQTLTTSETPAKVQKFSADAQTEIIPVEIAAQEVADVIEEAIASLKETAPPQTTPPLTTTDNASQTLDDYFAEYFKTNTIGSQTEVAAAGSTFGRGDPMLFSQYTQTCEEIMDETINPILKNIEDYEFATNIQTQTNWNMEDFLLVSTETQTSFSSCFLNSSHTQTTEFLTDDRDVGEESSI